MLFSKHFSVPVLTLITTIISLAGCAVSEDSTHNLLREARNLEFSGEFKKAEEAFKKIPVLNNRESSPLQLAALIDMAAFYLRTKDYAKAIITCDKALRVCDDVYGPNDGLRASILFIQASAYEDLKDYDKATSIYNSLILFAQRSPQTKEMRSMLPLVRLGDIQFKKNNFQRALKLYYKASVITLLPDPLYRIINYRLGVCSVALGRTSGSESYFKNSLPVHYWEAGPAELFDTYARLLKKNYKYGGAGLVLAQRADWVIKRKEYLDWLYARAAVPSQFNLLDKSTEKDFLDYMENAKESGEFDKMIQNHY
jgi:tetratricopeptide (TPR) repeat protein